MNVFYWNSYILLTFKVRFHWFIFAFPLQSHQSQLEIFDENVAHISTWLYQAEALLDEIEKKPANKKEETVKVAKLNFYWHGLDSNSIFWIQMKVCQVLILISVLFPFLPFLILLWSKQ